MFNKKCESVCEISKEEFETKKCEIIELLKKYEYNPTEYGVERILKEWIKSKGWLINAMRKHPDYEDFKVVFKNNRYRELDKKGILEFQNWLLKTTNMHNLYELVRRLGTHIESEEVDDLQVVVNSIAKSSFVPEDTISTKLKLHPGEKTSRFIAKLAKVISLDKMEGWNREFAKYSDAINPLNITRYTVFSVDPIDYYTMSFGNSWSSCHTIDKANIRDMPNGYDGMYSNGTQSYMLDPSSVVFYTVSPDYEGRMQDADKITRQIFHIGEEKIIQSRLYPKDNDFGSESVYKNNREIVQRICSQIFEVPNYWINRKGKIECKEVADIEGPQYTDILYFDNCNVSYLKKDELNVEPIYIGVTETICPECGGLHDNTDNIMCEKHSNVFCSCCGHMITGEEVIFIDGEPYCRDCCFYCNYHDDYEIDSGSIYVEDYGDICYEALDSGNFYQDNYNREYYYGVPEVTTSDEKTYCTETNAIYDGNVYVEGYGWVDRIECTYCEVCGENVLDEDYDFEEDCCNNCLEIKKEKKEHEEVA